MSALRLRLGPGSGPGPGSPLVLLLLFVLVSAFIPVSVPVPVSVSAPVSGTSSGAAVGGRGGRGLPAAMTSLVLFGRSVFLRMVQRWCRGHLRRAGQNGQGLLHLETEDNTEEPVRVLIPLLDDQYEAPLTE